MSAYLSTASAVANYQTLAGMSAYLSTAAASANFIGTSAYATTAQAQAGTSTTTVVNPSTLFDAKVFGGFKNQQIWGTSTSGVGATSTAYGPARQVGAPTSATGFAIAGSNIMQNKRGAMFNAGIDWTKRVVTGARLNRTNTTTPDANTVFRFSVGKDLVTLGAGDLAVRGVMAKTTGTGALQLLVHNGTTLTTVTSSFTPTNNQAYDLQIISDGAGNVSMLVNDSSVATTTGGPTTIGIDGLAILQLEVQNTSALSGTKLQYTISDAYAQINL
jgi:hypothetical protein